MSTKDSIDEIEELMRRGDTASIEKIMDKFIIADKNLILKTDIENSKNFTLLKTIVREFKIKKLKKSSATLETFCEWYIKVRVSSNRLSRKEILDAISAIKRENTQTSIGARLFGFGKDKD